MTPEEAAVAKAMRKADKSASRHGARVAAARDALREAGCSHPVTRSYPWTHDNGYGRMREVEGDRCVLCGFIRYFRPLFPARPQKCPHGIADDGECDLCELLP